MSQEKFKDINGAIRSRKLKKDRQHNCQRKKDKRANNNKQNTAQKLKDRGTRIPPTITGELMCSGRASSSG